MIRDRMLEYTLLENPDHPNQAYRERQPKE
jgi:hypothetical protein